MRIKKEESEENVYKWKWAFEQKFIWPNRLSSGGKKHLAGRLCLLKSINFMLQLPDDCRD